MTRQPLRRFIMKNAKVRFKPVRKSAVNEALVAKCDRIIQFKMDHTPAAVRLAEETKDDVLNNVRRKKAPLYLL